MMKLHADAHFRIGKTHLNAGKPNQDYAVTKVAGDAAVAIVSDGCSSGGNTDVGARIVAHFGLSQSEYMWYGMFPSLWGTVGQEFNSLKTTLALETEDLLATLVYANVRPEGIRIGVRGDGVVAVKYRDGRLNAYRFEWDDNMPFYPAYLADDAGAEAFIQAHGGDEEAERFHVEWWSIDGPSESFCIEERHYSVMEGVIGQSVDPMRFREHSGVDEPEPEMTIENIEEIECVALFTDGVTQIEGLDWQEAVYRLLSFKTTEGDFVKRRLNGELRRLNRSGNGPLDDISMAVIRIEHSE